MPSADPGFLIVDRFMQSEVDARALGSALETGLIDRLIAGPASFADLMNAVAMDAAALRILLDLLKAAGVLDETDGRIGLTAGFLAALRYRDLLEAKIDFADLVAPDFINLFTALLADPGRFMREAKLFELFDYGRCFDDTPTNREMTRRWMRFTTALTRHEAGPCMDRYDFARHRRMLDIGGNSGEFAFQICRRHPALHATVLDLPLVCRIGREHLAGQPESARISFLEGSALEDGLPGGFDLVTFKSMLHDWPEELARRLLERATEALDPGGTLLIFERGPIRIGPAGVPYTMIPMLLFFRSFRLPSFYVESLRQLGYGGIAVEEMELDTPFFVVTGRRAG